ncbi:hypothetical protein BBP40_002591 [Aspergillus hancockii]|nr:hypothetical protein BBP40_002591 [Aspergillus hancockii]
MCGFCSKSGLQCHYHSGQQTPGLRAGYVSRLENRIAVLEREFENFKEQVSTALFPLPQSVEKQSLSTEVHMIRPLKTHPVKAADALSAPLLSHEGLRLYCTIWFDQYHSWFPILHQPTILESCQQSTTMPVCLVLRAIATVIIPTQPLPPQVDEGQRQQWLLTLEDEIMLAGMHSVSLQTLQALLILTISVFWTGRVIELYNLIALCKRISTQLGLRDLVNHHCTNFGVASAIPPRMLFIPLTAVEREEKIRAFWATEALDSISTLGAAWHLSVSPPEPAATVPCDEEIWQYPESVLATYLFGNTDSPSSFSLFVSLATNELWYVHQFFQQSYNTRAAVDFRQRKKDCDTVYQRLMAWLADFERILVIQSPPYIDLFSTGEGTAPHPNSILIHCTIHSAVISLYQRFIFPAEGASDESVSWTGAADRCLSSCDAVVLIVRGISDVMLETINPHVMFCIFVAARFYIIYARASGLFMSDKLYLLIYAFTVAGKRWPLAKQMRMVLETAASERQPASRDSHSLPPEFYDLQYLSWDTHEAIREWVQTKEDSSIGTGVSFSR